jgi:hypothetical protein
MALISSLLYALLLTIVIELLVACFFGYRKKLEIFSIICINLLTNPLLNYLFLINNHFSFMIINLFVIISLEVLVVLIEWKLLVYALHENSRKMFVLSLAMNFCSYIAGVLIFK